MNQELRDKGGVTTKVSRNRVWCGQGNLKNGIAYGPESNAM